MTEPFERRRADEMSDETRKLLADLRPEELETLRYLVTLPEDDVKETVQFVKEMRVFGKWARWLILGVLAIFLGTLTFFDGLHRAANLWRNS